MPCNTNRLAPFSPSNLNCYFYSVLLLFLFNLASIFILGLYRAIVHPSLAELSTKLSLFILLWPYCLKEAVDKCSYVFHHLLQDICAFMGFNGEFPVEDVNIVKHLNQGNKKFCSLLCLCSICSGGCVVGLEGNSIKI